MSRYLAEIRQHRGEAGETWGTLRREIGSLISPPSSSNVARNCRKKNPSRVDKDVLDDLSAFISHYWRLCATFTNSPCPLLRPGCRTPKFYTAVDKLPPVLKLVAPTSHHPVQGSQDALTHLGIPRSTLPLLHGQFKPLARGFCEERRHLR